MIKIDEANRTYVAQRALAAGFENFLFAGIRSKADAEDAASAVRSEPTGSSGVRMDRRSGYIGGYGTPEEIIDRTEDAVIAIMIEKEEAVANIEEILSVEGIDMVQFGHADYAVSLGCPGEYQSDEIGEVEEELIAVALDAGVSPRAELVDARGAEYYHDRGVTDFSIGTDIQIVHEFLREQGPNVRADT
jgi:2-keto-3-deoxy-L-rhamnonate aldolase RhmA